MAPVIIFDESKFSLLHYGNAFSNIGMDQTGLQMHTLFSSHYLVCYRFVFCESYEVNLKGLNPESESYEVNLKGLNPESEQVML